ADFEAGREFADKGRTQLGIKVVSSACQSLAVDDSSLAACGVQIDVVGGAHNAVRSEAFAPGVPRNRSIPIVIRARRRRHGIHVAAVLSGPRLTVYAGSDPDVSAPASLDRDLAVSEYVIGERQAW